MAISSYAKRGETREDSVLSEDFEQVIKTRTDGFSSAGHANRMNKKAGFYAQLFRDLFQNTFERSRIERFQCSESRAHTGYPRLCFRWRQFLKCFRRILQFVFEIKIGKGVNF